MKQCSAPCLLFLALTSLAAACSPTSTPSDGSLSEDARGSDASRLDDGSIPTDGSIPADSSVPRSDTGVLAQRVMLGTASRYVILAKSGISAVPTSAVTGDVAISPAAATFITGFSLTQDATGRFATSAQVTGQIFAADYASPTPAALTLAVGDMERAFADAAGRAPNVTELGAGNIGGLTLPSGVYRWGTGLLIPTNVSSPGAPPTCGSSRSRRI